MKRATAAIVFIIVLCLNLCFANEEAAYTSKQAILNVSLYKILPNYDSFEETVEECWKEKHSEVKLNFVDWDCYSGEVPEDLDVFVFDATSLDAFVGKEYLRIVRGGHTGLS